MAGRSPDIVSSVWFAYFFMTIDTPITDKAWKETTKHGVQHLRIAAKELERENAKLRAQLALALDAIKREVGTRAATEARLLELENLRNYEPMSRSATVMPLGLDIRRLDALLELDIDVKPADGGGWLLVDWRENPPRTTEHKTGRAAIDAALANKTVSNARQEKGQ